MTAWKKGRLALLLVLVCAACAVGLFLTAPRARAATNSDILYFVNLGVSGQTDAEKAYGLTGTLGTGDKAYEAGGYGYVTAGTPGSADVSDIFASYVTGSPEYKFDLTAGTYSLAVGFASATDAVIAVNGADQEAFTAAGNKVVAVEAVSEGSVTVKVTGDAKVAFLGVFAKDSKVLLHASYAKAEVVRYASLLESKATGYWSDGTVGDVAIDYTNLDASELNRNWMMVETAGVISGTTAPVSRTLITMPEDLIYFVNCGSTNTSTDPEMINDVYWDLNAAVFEKFPELKNNGVIDQEYKEGQTVWGYNSYSTRYPFSSKPLPEKAGDAAPPAYPFNTIRCTGSAPYGIGYTFELEAGSYNLYLGTRSHWHARTVKIYINDEQVDSFSLSAVNRVDMYKVSPDESGKVTIFVEGKSTDEGNIAFLAVQPSNAANDPAAVPEAPTAPASIELGATEFTVSGVAAGNKLQVSLADKPRAILYECVAEGGDITVTLPAEKLAGVYRLSVAAVSTGGVSEYVTVYITDITAFSADPTSSAWTTGSVGIDVSATALSGLTRLEVEHNYYVDTVKLNGDTAWTGSYTATENGVYEFRVYSESGSFYMKSVTVANIDREAVTIAASAAETGWKDGKLQLTFKVDSVADVTRFAVYRDNALVETLTAVPQIYEAQAGSYSFLVTTASGRTAAAAVQVSETAKGFSVTTAASGDATEVKISAAEGKEIEAVYAYQIADGTASRVMVAGGAFQIYEEGDYAVMTVYADGSSELVRLHFGGGEKPAGMNAASIALLAVGCVLAVAAAGAAVWLFAIKKKNKAA